MGIIRTRTNIGIIASNESYESSFKVVYIGIVLVVGAHVVVTRHHGIFVKALFSMPQNAEQALKIRGDNRKPTFIEGLHSLTMWQPIGLGCW